MNGSRSSRTSSISSPRRLSQIPSSPPAPPSTRAPSPPPTPLTPAPPPPPLGLRPAHHVPIPPSPWFIRDYRIYRVSAPSAAGTPIPQPDTRAQPFHTPLILPFQPPPPMPTKKISKTVKSTARQV